jgi:hypothetical protein
VGVEFPSVSLDRQDLAQALQERLGSCSARAHSALAAVALAAAEFDEINGWGGGGIRSFEHWLAINAGFDLYTGKELLRVGKALRSLPLITDAFSAGRLSLDKVRQITTIASPATEEMLLEIALGSSGSQLARICSSLRRLANADAPDYDRRQLAARGLWTELDEEGMMRLVATLPAEDAAVVMAALELITGSKPTPDQTKNEVKDPAEDGWAARRADALVAMCEHVLARGADDLVRSGATRQVVVHVDVGVLTGDAPDGHCHIEDGAPLSVAAARRISCDAEVLQITERDGLPIDVGRKRRFPPDRLRRALEVRDRFCRFPGCGVPARQCHAHHLESWITGGPTSLDNLVLLCSFHHHRHHDGGFRIRKVSERIQFETDDGHVIGSQLADSSAALPSSPFEPETPRATWGGGSMDLDHTIWVIANHMDLAEARAAPPLSG